MSMPSEVKIYVMQKGKHLTGNDAERGDLMTVSEPSSSDVHAEEGGSPGPSYFIDILS